MKRPAGRLLGIGSSLTAGLFLWCCAFLLTRIGEGTYIPAVLVSSPLTLFTSFLLPEKAMVGFFLTPAYWILLGWVASWRSEKRTVLLIVLLLAQYIGAVITIFLFLWDDYESNRFQTEMEHQPLVMGLFILVYLLAHVFLWYCAGPVKLPTWRANGSSDEWWPTKPEN